MAPRRRRLLKNPYLRAWATMLRLHLQTAAANIGQKTTCAYLRWFCAAFELTFR